MLDIRRLREQRDFVQQRMETRHADIEWNKLFSLDQRRRELVTEWESLKERKNTLSGEIGRIKKSGGDATDYMKEIGAVSESISNLESPLDAVRAEFDALMLQIPNLPHDDVPEGTSADDNREVRKWGDPPTFGFQPKNHWEIGEKLGILDFGRGAKIAGSRFTLYRGQGALLERALIGFMLDLHTREHGYEEVIPPFLANRDAMTGTGQLPKFEEDMFRVSDPEFFLVPTAEVPLTNIHRDEILGASDLPRYYCAYTPCFRREAGSYGQDVRGLIRQHQFNKVELVKIVEPQNSFEELEKLTHDAETVLQKLDLPYRVVELCTGDLGFSAAKTYDIEVWLPGQQTYREISSCSNCTDFQARRANIRYRPRPKERPAFAHTLNGSGLAVGRTVVALIENCQQEDGTVLVPDALQPYMGGLERIG